ncbi:MAG: SprT-like domain-containing protein [Halanaeroarchaeum sp.]
MAERGDDVEYFAIPRSATEEEFLAAAKVYARHVVADHDLSVAVSDLEWEVSTRAKRRAGAVIHADGTPTTIRLTWEAFETNGWGSAAETIRHELIHAHLLVEHGDASHGPRFERLADELDTARYCEPFAEPRWWVTCRACGTRMARFRRSKLVEHPEDYRCGECGGSLSVTAVGD